MTLEDLGYSKFFEEYRVENNLTSFEVGRVTSEHKERYIVKTDACDYDSEIVGNLRFNAKSRSDFPAVGDWVAFSVFNETDGIIHSIFPRRTVIERQMVGKFGEKQIIAANIDYALIVQAADRDFNINRIERYLTICFSAKVTPIILINKIDLIRKEELESILDLITKRIEAVPVYAISNESLEGYEELKKIITKGNTYCFLGSSGVGKSTLINNLCGKEWMKTDSISTSTNKGRHVTSHREMFVLESGGILIDNPGMREIGITDASGGLETTFDSISKFSTKCKYKDCTHIHEDKCAILDAVEKGEIEKAAYDNYIKMRKEQKRFQTTIAEKRNEEKIFGKIIKNYKKNKNKY
jgi:ribosome biogenesis GTPase